MSVEPSPAERAVLIRLSTGETNKEIGNALGLTEATVKVHITNLIRRLRAAGYGVDNRVRLLAT